MKFKCGPTVKELYERKETMENWHDHFAWWPVRIARDDCRWLETVQRLELELLQDDQVRVRLSSYREKPR